MMRLTIILCAAMAWACVALAQVSLERIQFHGASEFSTRDLSGFLGLPLGQSVCLDSIRGRILDLEDFQNAMAVTIMGTTSLIEEDERRNYFLKLYLDRLPHLSEFVASPDCALILVKVTSYYLVENFQNVMEFHFQS